MAFRNGRRHRGACSKRWSTGASAGGSRSDAADNALRWLEALPPPIIIAPISDRGRGYTAYVPNNDGDAESDPTQPQRVGKQIRALLLPPDSQVFYAWDDIEAMPEGLPDLVNGLYQLGRGVDAAYASLRLVDMAEVEAEASAHSAAVQRPGGAGADGVDCPMPGTLDTLDARFDAFRARLAVTGKGRAARVAFTNPPRPRFAQVVYDKRPGILVLDLRDSAGRFRPVEPAEVGLLIPEWLADAAARLGPGLAAVAERFVIGRGAGLQDVRRRVRAFPVVIILMKLPPPHTTQPRFWQASSVEQRFRGVPQNASETPIGLGGCTPELTSAGRHQVTFYLFVRHRAGPSPYFQSNLQVIERLDKHFHFGDGRTMQGAIQKVGMHPLPAQTEKGVDLATTGLSGCIRFFTPRAKSTPDRLLW